MEILNLNIKTLFLLYLSTLTLIISSCHNDKETYLFDRYDPLVWQAMVEYKDGHFRQSLSHFEKAFNIISNDSENDYFHAISASLEIGENEYAEDLLTNAIIKTNPSKNYFQSFHGFDKYRSTEMFKNIEEKYDSLIKEFYKNQKYSRSVEDEIRELIDKDQAVRSNNDKEEMARVDSLNINRFIEITKEYGWIDRGCYCYGTIGEVINQTTIYGPTFAL